MWLSVELKCSHILSFFALTIKLQGVILKECQLSSSKKMFIVFFCVKCFSESCPQLFGNSCCMILHLETSSFSWWHVFGWEFFLVLFERNVIVWNSDCLVWFDVLPDVILQKIKVSLIFDFPLKSLESVYLSNLFIVYVAAFV